MSLLACGSAPPREQPSVALLPGGALAAFSHYGTNPTIDTAEEAVSRVGLAADRASMAIVRHYLSRGVMPPPEAVRVEDLVAATVGAMSTPRPTRVFPEADAAGAGNPEESPIGLDVALVPSPFRTGWHALIIAITAPRPRMAAPMTVPGVVDTAPLVVSQAPRGVLEQALAGRGARLEAGGVESLRRTLREAPGTRVVWVSDGAGLGGVDAQAGLIDDVRQWRSRGGVLSVVEVLGPGADDALLDRLALEGGGLHEVLLEDDLREPSRVDALAQRLTAPIGLHAATAEVVFDPDKVSRWRLVGSESRTARAAHHPSGAAIPAAETVFLYYEVKVIAPGSLGALRVTAREATASTPLESSANPVREARAHAVVAVAAFAEKLRGSFWVKDVAWEAIATHVARWASSVSDLVARARALDTSTVPPGSHARDTGVAGSIGQESPIRATRPLPVATRP